MTWGLVGSDRWRLIHHAVPMSTNARMAAIHRVVVSVHMNPRGHLRIPSDLYLDNIVSVFGVVSKSKQLVWISVLRHTSVPVALDLYRPPVPRDSRGRVYLCCPALLGLF